MNSIESYNIASPADKTEECAKFSIDDITTPFVLHDITKINQLYTLTLWIKSDTESNVSVCNNMISSTTEWTKHVIVFTALSVDLKIFFNSIGTYYIYHPKLEIGNKSTDWTKAPEDIDDSVKIAQDTADSANDKFDNLEIGGRNLLLNSNISYTATGNGTATNYASSKDSIRYDVNFEELSKIPVGSYITMSVYVKVENAVFGGGGSKRCGFEASLVREDGTTKYSGIWLQACENFEGRISNTLPILENDIFTGTNAHPYLYIQGLVSGTVTVSHPKLEIGNKATAWTPAPEDVDDKIDNLDTEIHKTIIEQNSTLTQTCESIILEASKTYAKTGDLESFRESVNAQLEILSEQISLKFTESIEKMEDVNGTLQGQLNTITKYFTFDVNGLTIGQSDNPYKVVIDNDRYSMLVNGVEAMWIANGKVYTPEIEVTKGFKLFGYLIDEDSDENVNCTYVGGGK